MGLFQAWRWRALVGLLVLPPLLSVLSLDRVTGWIGRRRGRPLPGATDADVAWFVERLQRRLPWPWRQERLRRAVVLFAMRSGPPGLELVVGKQTDAP